MPGHNVEFPANGGRASGYLSAPDSGRGPGVIVIQEWWGLNAHIRSIADRLAAEGFVALAPDLYHGRVTREPDEAGKLMMALNIEQAARDLRGAAAYLLGAVSRPEGHGGAGGPKVGVVGFCMGGQLALYAGTVAPDQVGAVVDFYGIHPNVRPDFARLQAPVLGLFAERDSSVTPEAVRSLEQQLHAAGKQIETHVYPGVDHAFFNDERPEVYNPEAARDAWERTLRFLRQHLGG
ncbi:MAG TPA: dienelactone hydrolase family protein [Chloroflexota bacterium]|jgi:carboxymethylenebutenolidase|nr:dienelactone hydrolase family protein [Chloroflexota bacterium]